MFIGLGTLINVATVLAGSAIGLLLGNRFPERTQRAVNDALGLVTLLLGALSAADVLSPDLSAAVGSSAPVLIVLGGLLIGAVIGSLLDLEARLDGLARWIRRVVVRGEGDEGRFVTGFVSAALLFCVGPLTVLGSLMEGLGRGPDQLLVKSVLDGFSSIAFAATLGPGVMASALVVAIVQGGLTGIGWVIGDVLPEPHLAALSAVGGLILVGLALRILGVRTVPVVNLLPGLIVAPLLVEVVSRAG